MRIALLACLLLVACAQAAMPTLRVANAEILGPNEDASIMSGGVLNPEYDEGTFNELLSCRNGNLNIIDAARGSALLVSYQGLPPLAAHDLTIAAAPNAEPLPFLAMANATHFAIDFNCSCGG